MDKQQVIKQLESERAEAMEALGHESYLDEFNVKTADEVLHKALNTNNSAEFEAGYIRGLEIALSLIKLLKKKRTKNKTLIII